MAKRILEERLEEFCVRENMKMLTEGLRIVRDFVEEKGWEMVEPRGGIYVFMRLPRIDSAEFCMRLLEKEKVAVAPGVDFGPRWREWIRITIARPSREIEEGLNRIYRLYKERGGG